MTSKNKILTLKPFHSNYRERHSTLKQRPRLTRTALKPSHSDQDKREWPSNLPTRMKPPHITTLFVAEEINPQSARQPHTRNPAPHKGDQPHALKEAPTPSQERRDHKALKAGYTCTNKELCHIPHVRRVLGLDEHRPARDR